MEAMTGETLQGSDSKFTIYLMDEQLSIRITLPEEKNQQIHLRVKKHRKKARNITISVKNLPIKTKQVSYLLSRSDPIDET
jgi:hypothetical protein